jgi:hypothetical protein
MQQEAEEELQKKQRETVTIVCYLVMQFCISLLEQRWGGW